jgi:hypothetical protein
MNHKEPDHGYCSPACSSLLVEVVDVSSQDDGNNNMARSHPNCTNNENWLAANSVNVQNSRNSSELLS